MSESTVAQDAQVPTCPECGKQFHGSRASQALGGHRFRVHGVRSEEGMRREQLGLAPKNAQQTQQSASQPVARAASLETSPVIEHVREQLRTLAAPLHEQLDTLDKKIDRLESELKDHRTARSELRAALMKLEPTDEKPTSKPSSTRAENVRAAMTASQARTFTMKANAVERIITNGDARWQEGFTANQIAEELTKRVPKGLSARSAKRVLDELRERGVVRADRIVRGGGMRFKLVTTTNGADDAETQT